MSQERQGLERVESEDPAIKQLMKMGYEYTYRCLCLVFQGKPDTPAHEVFRDTTGEISQHRWTRTDELSLLDIEVGARMVIEYYQKQQIRLQKND